MFYAARVIQATTRSTRAIIHGKPNKSQHLQIKCPIHIHYTACKRCMLIYNRLARKKKTQYDAPASITPKIFLLERNA